jgi:hypothetical protein
MIPNYHCRLLVLALAFIYLLLVPIINCSNDQSKETTIDKNIQPSIIKNDFYDLLKQEEFKRTSDEEQQIKYLIENFLKNSPYRRASSFHAMRGKRFI